MCIRDSYICARKAIIEGAKRIINSDKVCHSYSDFNFGVTFLEHSVYITGVAGDVGYSLLFLMTVQQIKENCNLN